MAAQEIGSFKFPVRTAEIAVLVVAFILRVWGMRFGLPELFHADEPIVVNHALQFGSGDLNPHFFNIPPLVSYLLFFVYAIFYLCGKVTGLFYTPHDMAALYFGDPSLFFILGRFLMGVLPAVASVAVLMRWLGDQKLDRWLVVAGGLLFAVCFIHVSEAHYVYTDMLLVFVATLYLRFLCLCDLSAYRSHIKLGLFLGLLSAIKYNGIFFGIPYAWMAFGKWQHHRWKCVSSMLIASGFIVLTFFLLNPYALLDFRFFLKEIHEQSSANQGVPFFHHLIYSLQEGLSWPLLLLGATGMLTAFKTKDIKVQGLALFLAFYYLVLWQKGQPFARYVLPLVPIVICFAVHSRIFFKKLSLVWWGLALLAVFINLAKDVQFDLIMARPDVRTIARSWIEKNIRLGSRVALDGTSFTPRLQFDCAQLLEKQKSLGVGLSAQAGSSLARLQYKIQNCENKPGFHLYYLTRALDENSFLFARPSLAWDAQSIQAQGIQYAVVIPAFHQSDNIPGLLGPSARLLKTWDPRLYQSNDNEVFDPQIITGGPFTWKDLFTRRENGYRLELYELTAVPVSEGLRQG